MNEDVVSNIRLSYLGTDMRDYFNEPVLSDDRTVVTIEPKRNDLRCMELLIPYASGEVLLSQVMQK